MFPFFPMKSNFGFTRKDSAGNHPAPSEVSAKFAGIGSRADSGGCQTVRDSGVMGDALTGTLPIRQPDRVM